MKYQLLVPNIGVRDVKETVDFYSQFLGFKEVNSVSVDNKLVWAMINAGNVNLMFQEQQNLIEEYNQLRDCSLNSLMTYYVKVKNKSELYDKVSNTEYLIKEIHTTPYGVEEFAIKDNNGFILVIAEDIEPILNYDNFFLPVDNYEEAKYFYSEILRLKLKFEFDEKGMAAFAIGNEEPAIILKDKTKFPQAEPTIWFEVDDVKKNYEILNKKGVKFISEPFQIKTGWAVEFTDLSGNRLGITDYVESVK